VSKDTPEPKDRLFTKAQRARLHIAATGVPQTILLFSVFDHEWTAWYTFEEASQRIRDAAAYELAHPSKYHKSRFSDFGHRTVSMHYRPGTPMRVDDFAEDGGTKANPETAVVENRRWGNFLMRLTVLLKSGSQIMPLRVTVPKEPDEEGRPIAVPAPYESGIVPLRKVEEYTASRLNDFMRF
jgi:hypothetical protein